MEKNPQFATMDGNEACAYVAYAFTEIAAIYPITPSSPMAGKTDAWSAKGRKNIFGQRVTLVEMESEAGAAGAIHGSLETGALSTSFTSSQGLMLMIPVMHRIAGERLPGVLHVASRTVGTHALSIFGDHSDVMNCRQTGFAMLSTANSQEIMDLAPVAHLSAVKGRIPFLHFFDGFRTSHEMSKVETIDYAEFAKLMDYDALDAFRAQALNPDHPRLRATVQNGDVYFQVREANNGFYSALPAIVQEYMDKIAEVTGRSYHLFDYYGAADAEQVVVAMGSVSGTIQEVVDYLNAQGQKCGFLQVHLYRPFSAEHFLAALPSTVKKVAVLDRCKEMGSVGEPLYQDVCTVLATASRPVTVVGGRYGLSSKDVDPAQILAVYQNLDQKNPRGNFTIGIEDDVTHLSLPLPPPVYPDAAGQVSCKFWGLGSDGTVGANKSTVEIINAHTNKYAQAYFEYDAKKSFGVTKSHLRFGDRPIRGSYYVKSADFIGCHNETYIRQYDVVDELKDGGVLLLNTSLDMAGLEKLIPARAKRLLAAKKAALYTIDAVSIAAKLGLGNHYNLVLQSAFFHLANIIPGDEADGYMKGLAKRTYFAKGDEVVARNCAAIDAGATAFAKVEIPAAWLTAEDEAPAESAPRPEVVTKIAEPINRQKGDDLPVSAFKGYEDGVIDLGLTAFEKRGIAVNVPIWDKSKCLQCNRCSLVCPHAVIRPYLLNDAEDAARPNGFETLPVKGKDGLHFTLQVSYADCTGCGACVNACPAKEKALSMKPYHEVGPQSEKWSYALSLSDKGDVFDPWTLKGSQFRQPLLEFSAACAGCGETPYAKLLTQLFGDHVYWANATGCSQAWGSPMPGIPYTTNRDGRGPAWSNSLFENNAEFALGMALSVKQQRAAQRMRVEQLLEQAELPNRVRIAAQKWLAGFDDVNESRHAGEELYWALVEVMPQLAIVQDIIKNKDMLAKKTFWMFGGDGWAYDIGFGGLDHVVASGENINVLVVDTEVYSNTGGQSSKATPIGAVAQFASSGKSRPKKDLGAIFMTYGNVYVAQVAMGADPNQLLKAIREAEEFNGPSVIIAYTPCLSHGLKCGMGNTQQEMKRAVEAGYWMLYRYNPNKEKPFTLDSKPPVMPYTDFLDGETRYAALKRTFPENAEKFFAQGETDAQARYQHYKHLEDNQ
ncbi:MAG: pyruvate:ferredoxin (flavodoxin) oxidoreductase [Victivallales bacterium]|nr:pyruvate:ferredoxin (flavodoxin) oxidoreductase [Victivallales bacterium]